MGERSEVVMYIEKDGTIVMRGWDDFHLHLREKSRGMPELATVSARHFARALVMPNTDPPIVTGADAQRYREEIVEHVGHLGFQPLMTIKLLAETTPGTIFDAKKCGVVAAKLYPVGVTTNSQDGIRNIEALYPVFDAMQSIGMVLCIHGERPGSDIDCLDRERLFLGDLQKLSADFPRLRIVLEHVSTKEAVQFVKSAASNRLAATVTVHHLLLTLNDLLEPKLHPHLYCKPLVKHMADRAAIQAAVLSGSERFFLGTDSAPHPVMDKECADCAAGVFSAPVAVSVLIDFFNAHGALHRLEPFVAHYGADFYGLPRNMEKIRIVERPWLVPERIHGWRPFMAGKMMSHQVKEEEARSR